ncbi:MAG TPA: tagaturonate reductase [Puia sp.]|nr:tagaturonate reductase [Puia sp.]
MQLSKENLDNVKAAGTIKPAAAIFALPEKVLQFGTGVLLRGLPDYFIDKANRQGIFNGRIVVVKSTDGGDAGAFDRQDGLYTLCVRGIGSASDGDVARGDQAGHGQALRPGNGKVIVSENIICSAISRVLSAKEQWAEILQCAHNPEMQIIISNTTEVGIQLTEDNILSTPPVSFPGKLLAFLYERYQAFKGSAESGMVIVPTELIVDNGKKLAAIIAELVKINKLEDAFTHWLNEHCRFCSSLVDRIVPGRPDAPATQKLQAELGYTDGLLSISEVYRLWAIEGDEKVQSVLSFAKADPGVIIRPDIGIFRELKLRLLNGTHTLSCGLAFLAGFGTVKTAMDDPYFSSFLEDLMLKEIAPAIPYAIPLGAAKEFGLQVLDRFRNPYIQHQWISITMQYSSKMKMRDIPVLLRQYERHAEAPPRFALGFAAYLLFMRAVKKEQQVYMGDSNGKPYPINDDKAGHFYQLWQDHAPEALVEVVLKDKELWGADLFQLKGFAKAVTQMLNTLMTKGAKTALAESALVYKKNSL